ncbi:murein DD-endopeptidase MepM/ murein hydrolase activator NlpD [Neomicrococcus aestuarii]|uniref:Murein DD-endopeptidase MepM/ murein hydrolase activator NlpD n=1 Tax=Neomicrococcus aestuarii TaxID=556325 RepID=A0A7W8TS22_9MICC|nr:peptidoglycan DD-metalloendopeptidase family protein [Neomicrococcus aestuarii]MBB5511872.1 murein DD-endopeptidase MepM/ murein hydrolase activator NlpD [Neomicrococcus aestuarii]
MLEHVAVEEATTAPKFQRTRGMIAAGVIAIGALAVPTVALTTQSLLFDAREREVTQNLSEVKVELAQVSPVIAPVVKSGVDNSTLNPLVSQVSLKSAATEVNSDGSAADGESVKEAASVAVDLTVEDEDNVGEERFQHPVASINLTSVFGWRNNPTGTGVQLHIGQDYGVSCGSPVTAAADGTVIQSAWAGHSGNRITLQHPDDFRTAYSHNTKLLVEVGTKVKRGDVIALAGTTGNSTGCHVHFEVQRAGKWVNPALFLPKVPGQPESLETPESIAMGAAYNRLGGYGHEAMVVTTPRDDVLAASSTVGKTVKKSATAPQKETPVRKTASSSLPVKSPEQDPPTELSPTPAPTSQAPVVPEPTPLPTTGPKPTEEPKPAAEPTPTVEPSPTAEPSPTVEPSPTPEPTPEPTVEPSPEPTPEPSATPVPEPSPTPTPAPTPEPSPSTTPIPTPSPTPGPSETPDPSASPTPAPSEEPVVSPADVLDPAVFAQQCLVLETASEADRVLLHEQFSEEYALTFSLEAFLRACGLAS